jgi:hypothetical protein
MSDEITGKIFYYECSFFEKDGIWGIHPALVGIAFAKIGWNGDMIQTKSILNQPNIQGKARPPLFYNFFFHKLPNHHPAPLPRHSPTRIHPPGCECQWALDGAYGILCLSIPDGEGWILGPWTGWLH